MSSIFGPITPSSAVEAAVLATAWKWLPTTLSETERQSMMTVGTLQRPRSAQTSYDFDNWPEGQLPAVVCVCPGTFGDMQRNGDGTYSAWFEVQAGVLVEDTKEDVTRRVSQLYQAALELALVQNGSLGKFASDLKLVSRQTRLPDVANRTLAYSESVFHVLVDGVMDWQGGPASPDEPGDPDAPYPPWTTIETTITTVVGEEPDFSSE